jgi:hypothetical protein
MRTIILALGLLLLTTSASAATDPLAIPDVSDADKICFALYTVHEGTLKLTAQLYPLDADDPRTARLEIEDGDGWNAVAETQVIEPGWTAPFRVDNWDHSRATRYRVRHGDEAIYDGLIRKDPTDKNEIVVAAFTGNSIRPQHGGDLPKDDILDNLRKLDADLLFFSGDQVYSHTKHYAAWLRFGRDFGDVIRNTPTVSLPDDHDVGMSNIWGAAGKESELESGPDGGYFRTVEYVNEVQRAQTSHLPDPYDPTPIQRGITVYYTDLTWGGISFAIIEDRKWKTGPMGVVPQQGPRPDHITPEDAPNFDPASVDVPGAELLGERQLTFLEHWAQDWQDAEMKAVLSQTVFAGTAHLHGKPDARLLADLDSNGWPQSGRNRALRAIRKAHALMICGDQHLGTVVHHGIDDWGDAGYSFCVPSIANLYLRWWAPLEEGVNRPEGAPAHIGEFHDGFGNKVTMHAVANPERHPNETAKLTTRAAGFGIVRFDKVARTTTLECWPRNVDATSGDANQYPGWPITVHQQDNYGKKPIAYLNEIHTPAPGARVQVIDESNGETVYTLRAQHSVIHPHVFKEGKYSVKVGEGKEEQTLTGVEAKPAAQVEHVTCKCKAKQ